MTTPRRDSLKLGCAIALAPAGMRGCGRRPARAPFAPTGAAATDATGTYLNDIHSQLNRTRVDSVVRPASVEELRAAILRARESGKKVSVAGGRHAMGGQQFGTDTVNLDMRGLSRVLAFDEEKGVVEVEAGIEWPELLAHLWGVQEGRPEQWGIVQKQTGADKLRADCE